MSPDIVLFIGGIVLLYLVVTMVVDRLKSVIKGVSATEALRQAKNLMICGWDGKRFIIYHRHSESMIVIAKSLTPNYYRRGRVGLRVTLLMGVPLPRGARLDTAYKWQVIGRVPNRAWAWRGDLPSARLGKKVVEIDCGSSLKRVEAAVYQIIADYDNLAENPIFYIWAYGRSHIGVAGRFEEE